MTPYRTRWSNLPPSRRPYTKIHCFVSNKDQLTSCHLFFVCHGHRKSLEQCWASASGLQDKHHKLPSQTNNLSWVSTSSLLTGYWCMCPPSRRSPKMWQVETNVDKLFCSLPDTMSRNNRGHKADSHFPGTFLLVSDVLYVTELSKWNGKYPPKTTFQSRVNAAGSVCDISQHYTGLLVYFFWIWRYFKVVTQWGPERERSKAHWAEWKCPNWEGNEMRWISM